MPQVHYAQMEYEFITLILKGYKTIELFAHNQFAAGDFLVLRAPGDETKFVEVDIVKVSHYPNLQACLDKENNRQIIPISNPEEHLRKLYYYLEDQPTDAVCFELHRGREHFKPLQSSN